MAIDEKILKRIEQKKEDYRRYNFIQTEVKALNAFFDLAQEFDSLDDFFSLCVAIPKSFFRLEACLYIVDPKMNSLRLAARSSDNLGKDAQPSAETKPDARPYYTGHQSLILTIRGKKSQIDELPFDVQDDVLGLLEIYPAGDKRPDNTLFFEKFANRIGFNIHNRFLIEKNIEHLKFIRSLVADIEHNIIIPNMVYKLFLRRLRGKATKNMEIQKLFSHYCATGQSDPACHEELIKEWEEVNEGLSEELVNIEKHYQHMSLFIETLFRKSHFDQGHLTLRTKACNMKKDVVQPQIERYSEQFKKQGIEIDDQLSGIPDEEIINVVDVGLIAQVYANLFSNALKYTGEVILENGEKRKFVAYGHDIVRNFFGPEQDGVKYNVFSSGNHIPAEERNSIFDEGVRGSNVQNRPGTGHGLAFIKNAVEIHGGVVGYEATPFGNNFYFILPC